MKFTKRQFFEAISNTAETMTLPESMTTEDVRAFAAHEIELLSKATKPTPRQAENELIKVEVMGKMERGKAFTVDEIRALSNTETTSQRMSAIIAQMVADGLLIRHEAKGKNKVSFELA